MNSPSFREPHAPTITKILKAAGFTHAVDTMNLGAVDGFKTSTGKLPELGNAPYVVVKFISTHPIKDFRPMVEDDNKAAVQTGIEDAARVLTTAGYDARVMTDGGNPLLGVYSQAARDAATVQRDRMANADTIAADTLPEGQWTVETESFPAHEVRRATMDHTAARTVMAKVIRAGGKAHDTDYGASRDTISLWVSQTGSMGTVRFTPVPPPAPTTPQESAPVTDPAPQTPDAAPTMGGPRPQVSPREARWHVQLIIGNDDLGETTDVDMYFGGVAEPTAADWPDAETDGWVIQEDPKIKRVPQGWAVPWNTDGYRAIIGEIRTNDFTEERETLGEWLWSLASAYYAVSGDTLPGYNAKGAHTQESMRAELEDSYPGGKILDMVDGDTVTSAAVTPDDVATAFRTITRWYEWHKTAARLPVLEDADRTPGFDAVIGEIMSDDVAHDPWGTGAKWMHAVADVVYHVHGEIMPGMSYGSGMPDRQRVTETYAGERLLDLIEDGTLTRGDLENLFTSLSAWDGRMRAWDMNY